MLPWIWSIVPEGAKLYKDENVLLSPISDGVGAIEEYETIEPVDSSKLLYGGWNLPYFQDYPGKKRKCSPTKTAFIDENGNITRAHSRRAMILCEYRCFLERLNGRVSDIPLLKRHHK